MRPLQGPLIAPRRWPRWPSPAAAGATTTRPNRRGPTEEPAALSKDELISQGDAICAEVNAAVGSVVEYRKLRPDRPGRQPLHRHGRRHQAPRGAGGRSPATPNSSPPPRRTLEVESELKLAAEREDTAAVEETGRRSRRRARRVRKRGGRLRLRELRRRTMAPTPSGTAPAEEGGIEVAPEELEEEIAPEEVGPRRSRARNRRGGRGRRRSGPGIRAAKAAAAQAAKDLVKQCRGRGRVPLSRRPSRSWSSARVRNRGTRASVRGGPVPSTTALLPLLGRARLRCRRCRCRRGLSCCIG